MHCSVRDVFRQPHRTQLCSGLSRHTSSVVFPRNATQGNESSNSIYSRHASAAALLAFRTPYRRIPNPPRSSESPPPSLSLPGRSEQRWPGAPEWGCALLWGQCSLFRYCTCEASGVQATFPKHTRKGDGRACSGSFLGPGSVSDVGIFSFSLGSLPDSTTPGRRSPPRRPLPSKPPPRAEVTRRCTRPQATATPSAWTCFSMRAPRRHAPAAYRVASLRGVRRGFKFQGPGGRRKM